MVRPTERFSLRNSTRRGFLAASAAVSSVAVTGCLGLNGPDPGEQAPDQPLDPPVKGDPDAQVTVKLFKDYKCGGCQYYSQNIQPQVNEEFIAEKEIRYEFHDYPLPVASESWPAASAARSVQAQAGDEAFWTYMSRLYENQGNLGLDRYEELTDGLAVDSEQVRQDASEQAYHETVTAAKDEGNDLGVERTPAVAVNGELVDWDSVEYTPVKQAIETAISECDCRKPPESNNSTD